MADDCTARARAIEQWRISPVTSLVVRWLMPAVGELMGQLDAADLDTADLDAAPNGEGEHRPRGRCDTCGEWTWHGDELGEVCRFPRPDGSVCCGRFHIPASS